MKTLATLVLLVLAGFLALWLGGVVWGIAVTVLHWAFYLALAGGVVYACYALTNPRKSLPWRSKSLP